MARVSNTTSQLNKYNTRIDELYDDLEALKNGGSLAAEVESTGQMLVMILAVSKEMRGLVEQARKNLETIDKSQVLHGDFIHKDELTEIISEISNIFSRALLNDTLDGEEKAEYAKKQLLDLLTRATS